jgi:hypothetical protein
MGIGMQHVVIGTPTLDGTVCIAYLQSLLETQKRFVAANARLEMNFILQDSLIMRARNQLVSDFLASEATDLIMIDSDIGWDAADILRLLRYDVQVAAGVYQRKSDQKIDFTVKFPEGGIARNKHTGLMIAERVGTGFLRLRRDALELMIEKYPELHYQDGNGRTGYCLFDTSLINGRFCGEDFTFCDRWRAIGGDVWVDPDIRLSHIGSKAFNKSLWEALKPTA